jgi:hypothetical protein
MDESQYSARREEADLLAEIGRYLFGQDLRVRVQLPAALAARAVAGWERDDTEAPTQDEAPAERTIRHEAGALALIGLAIEERSTTSGGDDVTVELDAWQIGTALDAAEERGLLDGLTPPDRNS